MKRYIIILTMGAGLFFSMFLSAQEPQEAPTSIEGEFERLGQTSMTFLDIDVGARAVGMGSAFTSMDNDVTALFWNPAGIAKINGGALTLTNTQWIADTKQYALAAAYGLDNIGTFGLSFMMMDNGTIERVIPNRPFESFPGDYESHPEGYYLDGTYTVMQWVGGIAYARQITNKFSIGGQIKYAYEDLGEADIAVPYYDSTEAKYDYRTSENDKNRKSAFAIDFGTMYYFGYKDLRIAMSFRNFAQPVKYAFESYSLPVTFKVAVAMNVLGMFSETTDHSLQISIVEVNPYVAGERLHVGGEYMFQDLIALRAGYRLHILKDYRDYDSYSVGFGLKLSKLNFDYAYSSCDEILGTIHRLSFGFTL